MSEYIYLVEVTGAVSPDTVHTTLDMALGKTAEDLAYDADGDGRITIRDALIYIKQPETFYFCTGGGYTDSVTGQFYEPRVINPGLFRQAMFAQGTTGGKSNPAAGVIELANTDGALDAFIGYGFDGRPCIIRKGLTTQALADFQTELTGTIEQVDFDLSTKVTLRLKDKSLDLATPVQSRKYAGTNTNGNGIEGEAALKDKLKPRLLGSCFNVSPVPVNCLKSIFQLNDSAISVLSALRENGVADRTEAAGYSDQADMEANAPGATEYRVWYAGGCVRVGMTTGATLGQITCDAKSGSAAADRTAGQLIKQLAGEKVGPASIVAQSIIDLDAAAPYEVGIYITADMTASAALDVLCNSVGAWWGFDNNGYFWARQLTAPESSQAIATLTGAEILTMDRLATGDGDRGVPIYKVNIDYAKNYTMQTSGLAGRVSGDTLTFGESTTINIDDAARYGTEYLRASAIESVVKTQHLNAPEITIQTLLTTAADAQTEADRILAMRSVRRDRIRVNIYNDALRYSNGGYWDNEAVSEQPATFPYSSMVADSDYLYTAYTGNTGSPYYQQTSLLRLPVASPNVAWEPCGAYTSSSVLGSGLIIDSGYIYSIGGQIAGTSAKRMNMSSGVWDDAGVTDLPTAHVGTGVTVKYGGYIYVFGNGNTTLVTYSSKVQRLNVASPGGAWDDAGVTDLPEALGATSAVIYGTYVYIVGGINSSASRVATVRRLNLASPAGAWDSSITPLPEARGQHVAYVLNGYLYVAGGQTTSGNMPIIRLNLANLTGAWETVSSSSPNGRAASVAVVGQSVYIVGGYVGLYATGATWRWRNNDVPIDRLQLFSLGRTINVQLDRYGYTAGRPMRIIGCDSELATDKSTLELWG
ncbi:MAG: hypothetical protein HY888_05300 [Deltaproteobacteria bacterium]|nr:hypothetical protein [Deltaproteobacteria bacterium]